uniref:Uncharacterized protein n=1 Tax=Zea mays TaxID=4577 RepID=C4J397_MAIZE|nr:unknown [Zea mays]
MHALLCLKLLMTRREEQDNKLDSFLLSGYKTNDQSNMTPVAQQQKKTEAISLNGPHESHPSSRAAGEGRGSGSSASHRSSPSPRGGRGGRAPRAD